MATCTSVGPSRMYAAHKNNTLHFPNSLEISAAEAIIKHDLGQMRATAAAVDSATCWRSFSPQHTNY